MLRVCGWLLPLGDASAAFECVKMLARNHEFARLKRAGARAQAEKLRWEKIAAQITAGYPRVLAGGSFAQSDPERSEHNRG